MDMASSDDEEENVHNEVTGYYFLDESDSPISFAVLPIQFSDSEGPEATDLQVFLHGNADGGLLPIHKRVVAWKLGFQGHQPELLVLSKDNIWIKLQKARKSYEESIRTTLVTIHMLHYLRENPETSEKNLWDHIRKTFRSFDVTPSEDDLSDHFPLIKQFTERDEILGKTKLLPLILAGESRKRTNSVEAVKKDLDMKSFIVEDVDIDASDEEPDLFDEVCALCDDGGKISCCEGECLRSFHTTRSEEADESKCETLGFTSAAFKAIQCFLCKNCEYKQHQCFACGKLGPSGKSANAKVFQCVNATCGHFYHPKCVAELLFPENNVEALEYEKRIASGESFTCPVHKCIVCKQAENKEVAELQFAICRRCPKSYHRKCLPRKIAFKANKVEGIVRRAWDGLLTNRNRILIYCLNHKIDEYLETPIRNHIIFPQMHEEKKDIDVQKTKTTIFVKKVKEASGGVPKEKGSVKPKKVAEKHSSAEEKLPAERRGGNISERLIDLQKNVKPLKYGSQSDPRKHSQPSLSEYKKFPNDQAKTSLSAISSAPIESKFYSSFPSIDEETEKRVLTLMEKASVSITLDSISKKHVMPFTHAHSAKHIDKTITHGMVEGFVEAIKTALQKVECGRSVDEGKAVCEPEILKHISKWNNKLKVYLAPFLHGMRYTSFGRHFTKVDKLKEIVDVLQWYVQSGDVIVDFCCGANDFSQLMKEKLEAAGKKCSFKNFDVIQPKNDFCFEKRDWMKVQLKDLPTGSQLIMGLNPPFGVKAALANKFIDKALTFKPKLLILIVPSETERLDEKKSKYDLIWENGEKLAGKSFYLPGSVNENDKQIEQWNLKPPVLYLWSRPDWTAKHQAIAARHNHRSTEQHVSPAAETQNVLLADAKQLNEEINDAMGEEVKVPELISSKRKPAEEDRFSRESSKNAEHSNKKTAQKMNEVRGDDSTIVDRGNKRKSPGNQKSGPSKRRKSYKRTESFDRNVADDMTSDMSISPPFEAIARNPLDLHQTSAEAETLFEAVSRLDVHQPSGAAETPFESNAPYNSFSEHRLDFGAVSGSVRSTNSYNEDIDGIAKRYAFNNGSSHRASSELGNVDHHIRSSEDRPGGYSRDSCIDTYGRRSHTSDLDGYRQSSGSDFHSQYGLYNQQGIYDSAPRNRHPLDGSDSSLRQYLPSMGGPEPILGQYPTMIGAPDLVRSQYSPPNFAMSNTVRESSAMQRYAPHLDETNYAPPSSFPRGPFRGRYGHFDMPGEPFPGRNGHFDMPGMPGEPFPGRNGHFDMPGEPFPGRGGHFDMPGMRRDLPPNPMGFAPGPHQFDPHIPGSAGWLDD